MVAPSCGNQRKRRTDVVLEITTDDSPLDLVAGRFDAGIHRGELIERHVVARVSRNQQAAIVASPRYFESHQQPRPPRDLPIIDASTSRWAPRV